MIGKFQNIVQRTLAPALVIGMFAPALQATPISARSIDGAGNNSMHPDWGRAGTPLRRILPAAYPGDGSGATIIEYPQRPNPRDISNAIAAQGPVNLFDDRGLSSFVWQWGQFIDHDIGLTTNDAANGTAPIAVNSPSDPLAPGPIPFDRSDFAMGTGTAGNPREQMNAVSSYIDASNVYGSDSMTAAAMRTNVDGLLKTSAGYMLPMGSDGYLAGDIRANEQVGLSAMHTLFVREHNRLAAALKAKDPGATDEELYQQARKIVGAELQSITYNEFLPALLGPDAPPASDYVYDTTLDSSIANEFSTAFYRLGHSMLSPEFLLVNDDGSLDDTLPLRDAFFTPSFYSDQPDYGNARLDQVLKGLAVQRSQKIDNRLVDDVRNFLFGPPGMGGLDLASLNIQRGRDHGLPDYNSLRGAFPGLAPVSDFSEITSDPHIQNVLQSLYGDVDNIDAWVGALAEDHRPGSSLGELLTAALIDQFVRLRDGDRFFYLDDEDLLDPDIRMLIDVDSTRLSDVILRNTYITDLQANVFFVPSPPTAALFVLGLAGLLFPRWLGAWRT